MDKTVFIPILTRNHNNYLKHYLRCIDELDYPKDKIVIYINTNNNDDDTVATLTSWMNKNHRSYKKVMFEHGDFSVLQKDMGWQDKDGIRLHIMSIIRQRSLDLCKQEKCDYFFPIDTDNWVAPYTLKYLIDKGLPLIAPFLKDYEERTLYSNYFYKVNEWGFIGQDPNNETFQIWHRQALNGTFEVDLVHCTYLLDCKYIDKVNYYDGSNQWEFITFANSARINEVKQYICNERMFGFVRYDTIVDRADCYELMESKFSQDNGIQTTKKVTNKDIVFLSIASKNNTNPVYADRRKACEQTWAGSLDKEKYFLVYVINDQTHPEFKSDPQKAYYFSKEDNCLYINAHDSWYTCYDRTRASLEWGMKETNSEYFWKVDDDTFINTKRFNNYDGYKNKDYTGLQFFYQNHLKLGVPGYFMHGGGYCVSRRIVNQILDKMPPTPKNGIPTEYENRVKINHEDYDLGYIISNLIPDAVVHSDSDIHPSIKETSPETLNSGKKIDNLLLAHSVPPDKMVLLYKMYLNDGGKDLRIPIGISSSNKPKYRSRREQIEKTWAREIDTNKFRIVWLVNDPTKTNGKDYHLDEDSSTLFVNAEDDYKNLSHKQRGFSKWFLEETQASHYWKCDDDTYINPTLFNKYDIFLGYDYTGRILEIPPKEEVDLVTFKNTNGVKRFMSGAGYSVSRRLAEFIVKKLNYAVWHDDHDIGMHIGLERSDISWYNEVSIYHLSGCAKIDNLMIGHYVEAQDMETMHSFYKEPA